MAVKKKTTKKTRPLPIPAAADRRWFRQRLLTWYRRHGRDLFLHLVDRLRARRPDLAMSSDFIVGFPGESDGDFEDTMRLIDEVGFASASSFKYSRRPGTPGWAMPDQVPESVKAARLAALQALLASQARDFNASKVGTTVPVLFAERGRKPGQIVGKTPWLQSVHAEGNPRLIGRIVDVRLTEGHANSLLAKQSEGVETALWTALRALEERAALCNRVAERLLKRGTGHSADRFLEQARDSKQRAAVG